MKIINKYVLREHLGPLLFALTALTSLLLLNYVAKRFGDLVGKGLPWSVIGEFFLLSIPFTVAMTLPMAVLVATLYAFSRLAAEHEVTAFKASGVSVRRLMTPVLIASAVLAVAMIAFNDQVLPRANHRLSVLQSDIFQKKPTFALKEQVTREVSDRLWLRAARVAPGSGLMHDVVIYDLTDAARPRTIYADSGTLTLVDQRDLEVMLFDGFMQEFPPASAGHAQSQRTFFTRDRVLVRDVGNQLERSGGQQAKSDREMTVCEMQARYTTAAETYREGRAQLEAHAAAYARAGEPATLPPRVITYTRFGLGALYCGLLDQLRVPVAFATTASVERGAWSVEETAGSREQGAGSGSARNSQLAALSSQGVDSAAPPPAPQPGIAPSSGGAAMLFESMKARVDMSAQQLSQYDVEIQKKFALAAACVVFVLIGAPVALRFPRGGVGLVIGVSLAVFALYYVGLIAGESLADKGYMPPLLAMWAANALFTIVGIGLLARMGREGGTGRGGDAAELLETLRNAIARGARRLGLPAERRRRPT